MSRFYGSMQGERGEVTRQGHRSIIAHPRGWNLGVRVEGFADDDDRDTFQISATGGSHGSMPDRPLMQVRRDGDALRVSVMGQGGGWSVFYIDREGNTLTRV